MKERNESCQADACTASVGINPSETNIEMNNNNLKRYRKQARKYFKNC